MNLKNNLMHWCINHANMLIQAFPISSKPLLFISYFLLICILLAGSKIRSFNNPNYPKGSLILREIASSANAISIALSLLTLLYFLTIFFLAFFAFLLSENVNAHGGLNLIALALKEVWAAMRNTLPSLAGGSFFGAVTGCYLKYFLIPELAKGEGLGDINDIANKFKTLNEFDPTKYFNIQKGCFLGASIAKKLIYIPWQKIRETHIQVIGTTGSGKGVIMSSIAYQSVLAGESVIWFDPKFDRFSPRILSDAAKLVNKQFHLINLNPDHPPQLNPIARASAFEIEELFVTAFDLKGKGTDGDFHRGKDEDAAILSSKIAIQENALSIPELIGACRNFEEITSQENFWRKLTKLGDLNVINTKEGLNLEEAILNGQVIYIIGSTDNERVKMLQKLVLVRVNQIIKKKDRFKGNIPTCIVLDEFKHLLSPTALTGLGVIRDFNAHCILAHQSLGDLDSCSGITRAEAEGAVLDNTAIKIVYRIGDSEYAEKLSKNSGKKRVFVEQTGKSIDKNNQAAGGWRETNVPHIDADLLTHLPMPSDRKGQASVGILFGVGISQIFFTGHVPTSSLMPAIHNAPKYNNDSTLSDYGDLDDLI